MCSGGGVGDGVDDGSGTTCGDVGGGDVCVLVEVVVTVLTMDMWRWLKLLIHPSGGLHI